MAIQNNWICTCHFWNPALTIDRDWWLKRTVHTVDGRNPKQPPGMVLKPCKEWDKLPYQLVSRISAINSITLFRVCTSSAFFLFFFPVGFWHWPDVFSSHVDERYHASPGRCNVGILQQLLCRSADLDRCSTSLGMQMSSDQLGPLVGWIIYGSFLYPVNIGIIKSISKAIIKIHISKPV